MGELLDFVMGVPGGMPGTPAALVAAVQALPAGATFSATGVGRTTLPVMLAALSAGLPHTTDEASLVSANALSTTSGAVATVDNDRANAAAASERRNVSRERDMDGSGTVGPGDAGGTDARAGRCRRASTAPASRPRQ